RGVRVIGVSMGSAIAQQLMIDRPDLVSRCVLIATWSRVTPSVSTIFETLSLAARHEDEALLRRILHNVTWTFDWTDAHPTETREMVDDVSVVPVATIVKQGHACATFDVVDELPRVTVPTLVTLGRQDLIIHPLLSRETA